MKGKKITMTFEVPENFEYEGIKDSKSALHEALNIALLEGDEKTISFLMCNILNIE